MGFTDDFDKKVKRDFDREIASHQVTLLHSDGLYRHWRCQKPGTGICSFDIVTWPGYLCYTGDMGTYVFTRTDDMIAFMNGSVGDFSYVAQKCVADDQDGIKKYYPECYEEVIDDEINAIRAEAGDYDDKIANEFIDELESLRDQGDEGEYPAMTALSDSGLFDELPDCKYYTYRFLFCMYALRWFCDKVNQESSK